MAWKCPKCKYPQAMPHDECPQCGVIVAKYVPPVVEIKKPRNYTPIIAGMSIAVVGLCLLGIGAFLRPDSHITKSYRVVKPKGTTKREYGDMTKYKRKQHDDRISGGVLSIMEESTRRTDPIVYAPNREVSTYPTKSKEGLDFLRRQCVENCDDTWSHDMNRRIECIRECERQFQ
jgi:hypothetical protein